MTLMKRCLRGAEPVSLKAKNPKSLNFYELVPLHCILSIIMNYFFSTDPRNPLISH